MKINFVNSLPPTQCSVAAIEAECAQTYHEKNSVWQRLHLVSLPSPQLHPQLDHPSPQYREISKLSEADRQRYHQPFMVSLKLPDPRPSIRRSPMVESRTYTRRVLGRISPRDLEELIDPLNSRTRTKLSTLCYPATGMRAAITIRPSISKRRSKYRRESGGGYFTISGAAISDGENIHAEHRGRFSGLPAQHSRWVTVIPLTSAHADDGI